MIRSGQGRLSDQIAWASSVAIRALAVAALVPGVPPNVVQWIMGHEDATTTAAVQR